MPIYPGTGLSFVFSKWEVSSILWGLGVVLDNESVGGDEDRSQVQRVLEGYHFLGA